MDKIQQIVKRYEEGYIKQNYDGDKNLAAQQKRHDFDDLVHEIKKNSLCDMENFLEGFPENKPLYKDSGRLQLRTDDMENIIIDQGMNESDIDFIERCKNLD